ncbi:hypothetical protein DPM19_31880 [Actinomadura craniellae]|uniref:DUF881 domain-containing protein n=1 Tax=Actinomadura craniellae TaxID=2231787 RepID=A0A365GWB4_9ACTN|nr:DUF881 domain-containing protein [Actinomadura craniellae]RAY11111.1 hypothetical protein DPM19_31880 [Actinomadura craniellae]
MTEPNPAEEPSGWSPGWHRPDASMSLLADLLGEQALDPGYAAAAARRGNRPPPRRGGMLLVLVLTGVLIAVAAEQVRRSEPVAQQQRSRLIEEVRDRTAATDELQRRLDRLRAETERLRAAALARSDAGRRVREELRRAGEAAAAVPVAGEGLVVTLDDARPPAGEEELGPGAAGLVYDQDLQLLVNGLWAAGAVAVGINGLRLTSTTAIRAAGEAILVDYRPLTPPYRVTALGDRDRLHAAFTGSAAARRLHVIEKRFAIRFEVRRADEVRLPGAGSLRLRHAGEPHGKEVPE